MTTDVPAFPRIEARTFDNGAGEVTINGTSHPIETDTIDDARAAILALSAETAQKVSRPVRVTTTGPDGEWPLIVHPDGSVEADETQTAKPAPVVEPEPETKPVEEPTPVVETEPAAEEAAPVAVEAAPPAENAWVRSSSPRASAPVSAAQPAPATRREARQSFLTQEQTEEPATQGWRGTLTRVGIRMSPSDSERSERSDAQAVSQHWPGPRTIAIVNGKGGASKTPTTVFLAAIFARYGGAGVLTWDNNQTRGTLGWRTEQGPHEATLLDLLPQVPKLLSTGAQSADLAHFVHHQTRDRFDVLRSNPNLLASEQRLQPTDIDAIHAVASKYYRLVFIDSGNDESAPLWLQMLERSDQIVVTTTTREDHAESAALLLEALALRDERSAALAENAVAVVSQADPNSTAADLDRIASGFHTLARETVTIPHDSAMVEGRLRLGTLNPSTQRAWLRAGAAVARGL